VETRRGSWRHARVRHEDGLQSEREVDDLLVDDDQLFTRAVELNYVGSGHFRIGTDEPQLLCDAINEAIRRDA
jgi:hypothetical protein